MNKTNSLIVLLVGFIFAWTTNICLAQADDNDKLLIEFLTASSIEEKQQAGSQLIASSLSFSEIFQVLKQGREYSSDVERGTFTRTRIEESGRKFHYTLVVPEDYQADTTYPLHIHLHGGINRELWRNKRDVRVMTKLLIKWGGLNKGIYENAIILLPTSWRKAMWWQERQVNNIKALLAFVKNEYNVDEDRIYLHGASDGGHGTYYFAAHMPTTFAAFVSLIGSPSVIMNPSSKSYGDTYPKNLINKPMFILNGERDRQYPSKEIIPFVEALKKLGAEIEFIDIKGGKHDFAWYNDTRPRIEQFVSKYKRVPYPDSIRWGSDSQGLFPRIHWLVLDSTGNNSKPGALMVDKQGNAVNILMVNVANFSLLISPEHFDINKEIKVYTNGALAFRDKVTASKEVLIGWATIDDDRSQLYAASIKITVGSTFKDCEDMTSHQNEGCIVSVD